ncbi:diaminopimelate epimerase [Streptomyces hoynatensis]|uniref:Diaminopimelate epimerase n=1 Tax=Streptomyces hoynatensis TaxID=1141874 RepID=A0A3A9YM79_9ACTN|nr:diaminopimelate epimerase [Streptomyces hoynatensis]RKN37290.1 diaminopimelate epimerase [Streptomyces hoynatensis]
MTAAPQPVPFLKGHGTENDFVIIPDPEGRLELSAETVAWLCDRRAGIGADGVLRVVRSAADPAAREQAAGAEWFMDYRNADGSIAEMCGNGARVFAHYLRRAGLVKDAEFAVATRAGLRRVRFTGAAAGGGGDAGDGGEIVVDMGRAGLPAGPEPSVTVTVGSLSLPARHVDMGNPHAVAFVDRLEDAGRLLDPPGLAPAEAYPAGANVEFAVDRGPRHLALRVHERGSGETRSCGTGACAVAVAAARRDGLDPAADGRPAEYLVDVPGGRLRVTEAPDGTVTLAGPAVIVAEGTVHLPA